MRLLLRKKDLIGFVIVEDEGDDSKEIWVESTVAVSFFAKRDKKSVGLSFVHCMECVSSLDAANASIGCNFLRRAITDDRKDLE